MITNALFQKSVSLLVTTLFLGVLFASVGAFAADKTIVLKKYPTSNSVLPLRTWPNGFPTP